MSVVAAALACTASPSLLVDLCGDQPRLFGAAEPPEPGLAGWLRSGDDVPPDALSRLEVPLLPGVALLPRGSGVLPVDRVGVLAALLEAEPRAVVVDAGMAAEQPVAAALVDAAERSLLVARACPLGRRSLERAVHRPSGVVVVREHGRAVRWRDVGAWIGAPVVAQLDIDPAVAAAVDLGLEQRRFPRSFLRVAEGLR